MTVTWELLYQSMQERWRPDDVAAAIGQLLPELAAIVRPAARSAWFGQDTATFDMYGRPGFKGHEVDTSITTKLHLPADPAAAALALQHLTGLQSLDFRDRIPHPLRKAAGIDMSRRQYNKLCRVQLALVRKLERLKVRGAFVRYTRLAHAGWAMDITLGNWYTLTPATRAFVAYYVARRQRQSVFSGDGQDPAWDRICEQLFDLSSGNYAVALAFPDERVLSALTHTERTRLLLKAYKDLLDMASTMAMLWQLLGADQTTMIVQRGMNSSDWNSIAGAWNSVRAAWVALLYACGREQDLAHICPGKAMRLMAADVASWHRSRGKDEGPDVKVFKQLPLPWDVVLGKAACPSAMVQAACRAVRTHDWSTPKTPGKPVRTRPTAALVHGVQVSDPALAAVLRRAGWFKGKGTLAKAVDHPVLVDRDHEGFALQVTGDVAQ